MLNRRRLLGPRRPIKKICQSVRKILVKILNLKLNLVSEIKAEEFQPDRKLRQKERINYKEKRINCKE